MAGVHFGLRKIIQIFGPGHRVSKVFCLRSRQKTFRGPLLKVLACAPNIYGYLVTLPRLVCMFHKIQRELHRFQYNLCINAVFDGLLKITVKSRFFTLFASNHAIFGQWA